MKSFRNCDGVRWISYAWRGRFPRIKPSADDVLVRELMRGWTSGYGETVGPAVVQMDRKQGNSRPYPFFARPLRLIGVEKVPIARK